jgi:DNA-binding transcriptional regulator YiaG
MEPLRMWEVVQEQLGAGYRPVTKAELERSLAEMSRQADDVADLARGRQRQWKWILGSVLITLRRALDDQSLTVIELTDSTRGALMARSWRMDTFFYDRFAANRGRMVDLFARLMMQVADDDWLKHLLDQSNGHTPTPPTVAERIKRRRNAKSLSVTALAHELGVSRTTVGRWEKGTAVPHPEHRKALAALLDGDPSDFA